MQSIGKENVWPRLSAAARARIATAQEAGCAKFRDSKGGQQCRVVFQSGETDMLSAARRAETAKSGNGLFDPNAVNGTLRVTRKSGEETNDL